MTLLVFLGRRFLFSAIALVGVVLVVFVIVRVLPGDPARLRAGPYASEEQLAQVRHQLGLSDPWPVQLKNYLGRTARLDLGTSIRTNSSVAAEVGSRLPATIELSLAALFAATVAGVTLGALAAVRRGGALDALVRGLIVLGTSTPVFWLGVLLIIVFYSTLHVAPAPLGRLPPLASPPPHVTGLYTFDALVTGQFHVFVQALANLVLPAAALAFVVFAPICNIARSSMLDALGSDYVRTARAVGLPPWRDAFRNALLPVITTIGAVLGYLLGGSVLIEQLFGWPGIGQYAWLSLTSKDVDGLQGVVILVGTLYIGLNVLIDLAYGFIDPRIRLSA